MLNPQKLLTLKSSRPFSESRHHFGVGVVLLALNSFVNVTSGSKDAKP